MLVVIMCIEVKDITFSLTNTIIRFLIWEPFAVALALILRLTQPLRAIAPKSVLILGRLYLENLLMIRSRGFTLIKYCWLSSLEHCDEVTITSFLTPQLASSADPQYQNRSVALGQSLMNQILARGFDEHSDFDGVLWCVAGMRVRLLVLPQWRRWLMAQRQRPRL